MDKKWMAIYTMPRSEKKVAERLEKKGVEVYCPLQTTLKQWSDRKKKVKIPVFPSYVFVCVNEKERELVLMDAGVKNFVFWLGKPAIIKDEEIAAIKNYISSDSVMDIELLQFNKGDKVDIIAGPFKDFKGTIESSLKSNVTVLIESLGVILKIKLKNSFLEKNSVR